MRQQLSFLEILVVCIGTIIGTGIFFIPGIVAIMVGHGSILVWAIIIVLTIPMGLCFADLASIFKKSGGPVVFVKHAFGDFFGFIAGWSTWILSSIAIGALSVALSYYVSFLIPLNFLTKILFSISILAIFTLINYHGIKLGARVEIVLTIITFLFLILYIVFGFGKIDMSNFQGFPINFILLGPAAVLALELFIGWESSTIISEEVKNAKKYIPMALTFTVLIIGVLYFFIFFVFLGNIQISDIINSPNPLATSVAKFAGEIWAYAFGIGAIFIGLTALNSWILTVARLPYAMARHKVFLRWFDHLDKKHGTPDRALLIQFIFASLIATSGSYEGALRLLMSVALIMYILCYASLIKLRKKFPERRFKVPLLFPVVSLITCFVILTQIEPSIFLGGAILILLGIPSYIAIKLTTNRKFVEKFFDKMAFVINWYIPTILYKKEEMKKVLENADLKKKQNVLDYGCGTGITTRSIANLISPGKVVAVDISKKQLSIAIKRTVEEFDLPNIIFVKQTKSAPFEPNTFDRIVSTIAINYFVYPHKELEQLYKILKKNGKISFLAIKAPTIPFRPFLKHDNTIKTIFETAGFRNVKIEREKKFIRTYIYITAKK